MEILMMGLVFSFIGCASTPEQKTEFASSPSSEWLGEAANGEWYFMMFISDTTGVILASNGDEIRFAIIENQINLSLNEIEEVSGNITISNSELRISIPFLKGIVFIPL
jgi:hypothetical protein